LNSRTSSADGVGDRHKIDKVGRNQLHDAAPLDRPMWISPLVCFNLHPGGSAGEVLAVGDNLAPFVDSATGNGRRPDR